jgi:hypothetical protein
MQAIQAIRAIPVLLVMAFGPFGMASAKADDLVFGALQFRATVGTIANSAGYFSITNNGRQNDVLIDAQSDLARKTEIHSMVMDNGVMRMRRVESGIQIPAGETVHLVPGGYHVMLVGLNQPLTAGASYSVDLLFKVAGRVRLTGIARRPADLKPAGTLAH